MFENYLFNKCIIETKETNTIKYNYYYTKNNEIIIEYENSNFINNEFKMESVKATYKNNKLLKCEQIIGNNNCDILNDLALNYENEINNILDNYNINKNILKYIKLSSSTKKF